jgi:PhnB protein
MSGADQQASPFVHGQPVYLQIPAVDIAASAGFYSEVLGWQVDPPDSGFEAPGLIGQWVTDRAPGADAGPVMWIHVDDLAQTLQAAERDGATVQDGPTPDGPRTLASFRDPAGNLVGIVAHGPDDPARTSTAAGAAARPPQISVMLIVPDGTAAVAWYREALGAEVMWDLGGVAGLHVRGAPFFLHEASPKNPSEDSPDHVGQTSVRIEVFVSDPDGLIERAVTAGATARSPVTAHEMPWGTHRQGGFIDPFGHRWSVGDAGPLRPGAA